MGSVSHPIQHVKLRQKTKFRVNNLHSIKDMEENPKEDWVQVPQSKNSFGAFLKWDLHLILFGMSSYARKQIFWFMT